MRDVEAELQDLRSQTDANPVTIYPTVPEAVNGKQVLARYREPQSASRLSATRLGCYTLLFAADFRGPAVYRENETTGVKALLWKEPSATEVKAAREKLGLDGSMLPPGGQAWAAAAGPALGRKKYDDLIIMVSNMDESELEIARTLVQLATSVPTCTELGHDPQSHISPQAE
jgi:hypothetical protein